MEKVNWRDESLSRFAAYVADQYELTIDNPMEVVEIIKGLDHKENEDSYANVFSAAALWSLTEIVKIMLANGADPNYLKPSGKYPLFSAIQSPCTEIVDLLLDAGADPDAVSDGEWPPVGHAARQGSSDIVELLLQRGANPNTKDKIVKSGNQFLWGISKATPLHWCISNISDQARKFGLHKVLLKYGADLEATDNRKYTPLIFAADRNADWIVEDLIQAGAKIDAQNNKKNTAAHVAAELNLAKFLKLLAHAGANLNIENKNGLTVVGNAAAHDSVNSLKAIMEARPECLHTPDSEGNTGIHVAAAEHKEKALAFLVENSNNVDEQNKKGMTPLMLASMSKYQSTIHYLVAQGSDIQKTNHEGLSAIDLAKQFSKGVVLKALQSYQK